MDEVWDVYNDNKVPTGRKILRSQRDTLQSDEYHLIVCMFFINSEGELLIQKRALNKAGWPGIWADTGGAVLYDETSEDGMIREVEEELGIKLKKDDLILLVSQKIQDTTNYFRDVYVVHREILTKNCVLDPAEVEEVQWVKLGEIEKMIAKGTFLILKDSYFPYLKSYINNNKNNFRSS